MTAETGAASRLSKRMRALAELIRPCGVLADVGCDHGFLSIYSVQSHKAERAIAMDVRPGPLERAAEHVRLYGCGDRIDLRLSDGLAKLKPGEADSILISGMGGGTILHILGEGWDRAERARELILQPQSEISGVRKFLLERGYCVEAEDMVEEDGKFYPMMRAVPGREQPWSRVQLAYGKRLLEDRNPVLGRYLNKEELRCGKLLENLSNLPGPRSAARREAVAAELADVRLALEQFAASAAEGEEDYES